MYLVVPFSPHRTTCSSALPPSWPRASVVPPKASQIRRHPLCHLAWPLGDGKDSRGLSPQRASAPVEMQQASNSCWWWQAIRLPGWLAGWGSYAGQNHPCTIAHACMGKSPTHYYRFLPARGPSSLCLCSSFLSMGWSHEEACLIYRFFSRVPCV